MAEVRKHIVFHGRVQGVGFRYTAKYLANSLNLVGWEIGTWLSEKFEIVRKAGIFMVEMLMKGVIYTLLVNCSITSFQMEKVHFLLILQK